MHLCKHVPHLQVPFLNRSILATWETVTVEPALPSIHPAADTTYFPRPCSKATTGTHQKRLAQQVFLGMHHKATCSAALKLSCFHLRPQQKSNRNRNRNRNQNRNQNKIAQTLTAKGDHWHSRLPPNTHEPAVAPHASYLSCCIWTDIGCQQTYVTPK